MKSIIILSFFIYSNLTFGQVQKNALLSNPDYYVYNNAMDTLYLTKIDVGEDKIATSKIFDTIQLDGLDSKEIIFERRFTGSTRDIKQASQILENTKIFKYEIWNIDTKTLLFEAVSYYEHRYDNWDVLTRHTNDGSGSRRGYCSYSYNFSIDSIGRIEISNLTYIDQTNFCKNDIKEGNYTFINGKYTYEK